MWQRLQPGVVELVLQHRHECLVDEGGLAASAHSAHSDETAQREVDIDILQVVAPCSPDAYIQSVAGASDGRHLYPALTCQVVEGDGFSQYDMFPVPSVFPFPGQILLSAGLYLPVLSSIISGSGTGCHGQKQVQRSGQADPASLLSCSGAHIHKPVGREHGLAVMLHYHYGVSFVPQLLQRCDQFAVVPLVQTDARLVQDIQHIYQPGTYLSRKPYPLAFPS